MPADDTIKTSLVIPVYNECENLRALHKEISDVVPTLPGPVEIIYVDDGSSDDSAQVLQSIYEENQAVQVVRLRRNSGKAAALDAGFARARGEVVVTLDADLQDIPAEIPRLVARLDAGWDLVSGWKIDRRDPFSKRVRSRLFNWIVGLVAGPPLHDHNCGLKVYRAAVIRELNLYGDLYRFIPVIANHNGFRVTEEPVHHRARAHGHAKYGLRHTWLSPFDLIVILFLVRWQRRPMRFFGPAGCVALLAALGIGILGWNQSCQIALVLMCALFGLVMFAFGFLGEIMSAWLHGREEYRIESVQAHTQEDSIPN